MQTADELKYSQSVWGFQPLKAEIRRVAGLRVELRARLFVVGAEFVELLHVVDDKRVFGDGAEPVRQLPDVFAAMARISSAPRGSPEP